MAANTLQNLSQYPKEYLPLIEEILDLKRRKRAKILVHNYLRSEIYSVADVVGDSLGLCEDVCESDSEIIVFAAVHFMAESAALLMPSVRVFLPQFDAGCALSDMITADQLRDFRRRYPGAAVVCYINSSAEVKAESDVICTSSNAVEVVRNLPGKQILFVPDKNLAKFVAPFVPEKEIIPWDGYCPIHHHLTSAQVLDAKMRYPNALVLAHPECQSDVLQYVDEVASTSGMVDMAKRSEYDEFIVLTECGLTGRMRLEMPRKRFYGVCNLCQDMKKTTLTSIRDSLTLEQYEMIVPESTARRAREAFRKMFALTHKSTKLASLVSPT